jgi:hypothetical protein
VCTPSKAMCFGGWSATAILGVFQDLRPQDFSRPQIQRHRHWLTCCWLYCLLATRSSTSQS